MFFMNSYTIPNSKENEENKFLGGYITGMHPYPDRSYISISMRDGVKTIYIMIFKKSGFGNKKYDNPTVKIVMDAFEKGIPITCVYTQGEMANVMHCVYTNFSLDYSSNEEKEETEDNSSNDNDENKYEQLELPL